MKKLTTILLSVLLPFALLAQTPREMLTRQVGTNTIIGSNASVPFQVSTIAALKATTVTYVADGQTVNVLGYYVVGDGGGGSFTYNSTNTATDNGGTVIAPTAGSGRWLRADSGVVNVRQFGAKADQGLTDNSAAFQAAVDSFPGCGTVYIPKGKYGMLNEVVLHGGITIIGDGSADPFEGAPPDYTASPTYIAQLTNNKAIFVSGGGQNNITIKNLSLAGAFTHTQTGATTGKYGIKLEGSYPRHVCNLRFESLTFYDGLERGISCVDPHAGEGSLTYPYDWAVSPVEVNMCRFLYPKIGVYLDTTNTDLWNFNLCNFFLPPGGNGIYLARAGVLNIDCCSGGGTAVSTNAYIRFHGHGIGAFDTVAINNVHVENCTNFIVLDHNVDFSELFTISVKNSGWEMGADVYLGDPCHFISQNNTYRAYVYAGDASVRIESIFDRFQTGGGIGILAGTPRDVLVNLLHGPEPCSYSTWTMESGRVTLHANAVPTTETWKVGDRCVNSAPASGQPKAWVCTVAGTGAGATWVSEGNL